MRKRKDVWSFLLPVNNKHWIWHFDTFCIFYINMQFSEAYDIDILVPNALTLIFKMCGFWSSKWYCHILSQFKLFIELVGGRSRNQSPTNCKLLCRLPVFQIGVGHRPLADKKWKWPVLVNGPARMAYQSWETRPKWPTIFAVFRPNLVLVSCRCFGTC